MGIYNDPKILACLHNFCAACLVTLLSKQDQKDVITCPLCENTTPLMENSIANLTTNLFLLRQQYAQGLQLSLTVEEALDLTKQIKYSIDTEESSQEAICSSRDSINTNPGFGKKFTNIDSHIDILQNNSETTRNSVTIENSSQSDKSKYKNTQDYKRHMNDLSDKLQKTLMQLQSEALRITYSIDSINQCIIDWNENKDDTKRKVHQRSQDLQLLVKRWERKLINDLNNTHYSDAFQIGIDRTKAKINNYLKTTLHSMEFLKQLLDFGSNEEILSLSDIILPTTSNCNKEKIEMNYFKFKLDANKLQDITMDDFGNIAVHPKIFTFFQPEISNELDKSDTKIRSDSQETINIKEDSQQDISSVDSISNEISASDKCTMFLADDESALHGETDVIYVKRISEWQTDYEQKMPKTRQDKLNATRESPLFKLNIDMELVETFMDSSKSEKAILLEGSIMDNDKAVTEVLVEKNVVSDDLPESDDEWVMSEEIIEIPNDQMSKQMPITSNFSSELIVTLHQPAGEITINIEALNKTDNRDNSAQLNMNDETNTSPPEIPPRRPITDPSRRLLSTRETENSQDTNASKHENEEETHTSQMTIERFKAMRESFRQKRKEQKIADASQTERERNSVSRVRSFSGKLTPYVPTKNYVNDNEEFVEEQNISLESMDVGEETESVFSSTLDSQTTSNDLQDFSRKSKGKTLEQIKQKMAICKRIVSGKRSPFSGTFKFLSGNPFDDELSEEKRMSQSSLQNIRAGIRKKSQRWRSMSAQ